MKITSALFLMMTMAACLDAQDANAQNANTQTAVGSVGLNQSYVNKQIAFVSPSPDLLKLRDAAQSNYQALQFQIAVDLYRRICQSPLADANDYYWLGESYFHTRQFSNATQAFSRAIALNPAGDNLRVRLVESLIASKQPDQAKAACTEALAAAKNDYAKRQLTVLSKVTDMSNIKQPKAAVSNSRTGHLEQ